MLAGPYAQQFITGSIPRIQEHVGLAERGHGPLGGEREAPVGSESRLRRQAQHHARRRAKNRSESRRRTSSWPARISSGATWRFCSSSAFPRSSRRTGLTRWRRRTAARQSVSARLANPTNSRIWALLYGQRTRMSRDKLIIFGVVVLGLLGGLKFTSQQAKKDESLGQLAASAAGVSHRQRPGRHRQDQRHERRQGRDHSPKGGGCNRNAVRRWRADEVGPLEAGRRRREPADRDGSLWRISKRSKSSRTST